MPTHAHDASACSAAAALLPPLHWSPPPLRPASAGPSLSSVRSASFSSPSSSETSFLLHNSIPPPDSSFLRASSSHSSSHRRTCSSSSTCSRFSYGRQPVTPRAIYASLTPSSNDSRTSFSLTPASSSMPDSKSMLRSSSDKGSVQGRGSKPPKEWVVQQLWKNGERFWGKAASSDVILLVPHPRPQSDSRKGSVAFPPSPSSASPSHRSGLEAQRRGSAPIDTPIIAYRLHRDYLTTQSTFFAKLLSSPPNQHSPLRPPPASADPTQASQSPSLSSLSQSSNLSTVSSSLATHLLSKLPNPSSFGLVLQFLYFGREAVVEQALASGRVGWQGFFRNIQYLGLDNSIKIVCARWWRNWIKPSLPLPCLSPSSFSSSSASQIQPKENLTFSSAGSRIGISLVASSLFNAKVRGGSDEGWLLELGMEGGML